MLFEVSNATDIDNDSWISDLYEIWTSRVSAVGRSENPEGQAVMWWT